MLVNNKEQISPVFFYFRHEQCFLKNCDIIRGLKYRIAIILRLIIQLLLLSLDQKTINGTINKLLSQGKLLWLKLKQKLGNGANFPLFAPRDCRAKFVSDNQFILHGLC